MSDIKELKCDFCEKDFNKISGRFLLGEFQQCWRCRLKEICKKKSNEKNEI